MLTGYEFLEAAYMAKMMSGGGKSAVIQPLTITSNGTYTTPAGVDGYNPVTSDVSPLLVPKVITANGTYLPPDNVDGFSSIYVNGIPETQINAERIEAVKNGTVLMEKSISNGWNLSVRMAELYSQLPEFEKSTVTNKPYMVGRQISERALFFVGTKDGEFKFATSNLGWFDGQPAATEYEHYRINNVSGESVLYQKDEWGLLNDDEFTKNQIEFNSASSNITISGYRAVSAYINCSFFWKTTTYADGQPSYSSYSKKQSRNYYLDAFGNVYYLGVGDKADTLLDFSNACNDYTS